MAGAAPNGPEQPAGAGPGRTRPGFFNRERFLFTLLAAVILTELLVYLTGTAVCSYRSLHGLVQDGACLTFLDRLRTAFDATTQTLLGLLGGVALAKTSRSQ